MALYYDNYISSFMGGSSSAPLDAGPAVQIIDFPLPTSWMIQQTREPLKITCIESLAVEFGTEKGDLMCGSQGTTAADRFITGQSLTFTVTYQDTSLEAISRVVQGFDLLVEGNDLRGALFTRNIGQKDSDIWAPIQFRRVIDSVESSDPLNHLTVPLAAPMIETFTLTRNNADQITWEGSYMAYPAFEIEGKPVLAMIGNLSYFIPD